MTITMNHTGFVVADLERSVKFYSEGLGLMVSFQVEAGSEPLSQLLGYENVKVKAAYLRAFDGHSLELIQYVNPPVEVRDPADQHPRHLTGSTHLSFIVADLEGTIARLEQLGATLLNPPVQLMTGLRSAYLQDPDGNWIELDDDAVHRAAPFMVYQRTAISPAPGELTM